MSLLRVDGIAAHRFGACVDRCERLPVDARERRLIGALLAFQELRHAEVEEPHLPGVGHQNVRGLEIAMNDVALVRVLHGREDLQEQLQALGDPEPVRVAPVGQRLALHVLHRQIRPSLPHRRPAS